MEWVGGRFGARWHVYDAALPSKLTRQCAGFLGVVMPEQTADFKRRVVRHPQLFILIGNENIYTYSMSMKERQNVYVPQFCDMMWKLDFAFIVDGRSF